jgi:SAM-dependent methyltransferase
VRAEALASEDEARRFVAEHAHYVEDLPFWRAAAARLGSPVLDVGAAAGRVTIPLARDGAEVWALDGSPAMLDELGRRLDSEPGAVRARVRLVEGDMRAPGLDRRFALVAVPMNTLQVLVEPEDRIRCLRALRDRLAPGGELVFDVSVPDEEEIVDSIGVERPGGAHRDPGSGALMVHSAWYDRWDSSSHTLEFTLRIVELRPGAEPVTVLRHHRVHLFTPQELDALLAEAGLVALEVCGGFAGEPVGPDSERQVYRCRAVA